MGAAFIAVQISVRINAICGNAVLERLLLMLRRMMILIWERYVSIYGFTYSWELFKGRWMEGRQLYNPVRMVRCSVSYLSFSKQCSNDFMVSFQLILPIFFFFLFFFHLFFIYFIFFMGVCKIIEHGSISCFGFFTS